MDVSDLVAFYGNQTAAGLALKKIDGKGVGQSTVSEWQLTGIPLPRQAQYELLTRGKLKADRPKRKAA